MTSLKEFYHLFEETVKRWRSVEIADAYTSFVAIPDVRRRMHSLELHVIEVYTKKMFGDFEDQFKKKYVPML